MELFYYSVIALKLIRLLFLKINMFNTAGLYLYHHLQGSSAYPLDNVIKSLFICLCRVQSLLCCTGETRRFLCSRNVTFLFNKFLLSEVL
jgi:hypothetical protein